MKSEQAILAIRHVVQNHGDAGTRLGENAHIDGVRWFGSMMGWNWPASYLQIIGKHDGVTVQDAWVFSFIESVQHFLLHHAQWHGPDGFWPVGSDGCGNYFALSMDGAAGPNEGAVVFFDMMASPKQPAKLAAQCYASFIEQQMQRQCERLGCGGFRDH